MPWRALPSALKSVVCSAGGEGAWRLGHPDEPELHLGAQVLVPDLAGRRRERTPALPDTAWFTFAPDRVCEVLSLSTAIVDRTGKQAAYHQQGVLWLWFVDPSVRTVEVLSRAEQHWIIAGSFGGDGEKRIPPFDAVPIDLGALWDGPGAPQSST